MYKTASFLCVFSFRVSLVVQRLKCLPAMREIWVRSLGREDTLEKEMATHSSILAWRIPWTEEPGGLQSTGSQRVLHNFASICPSPFSCGGKEFFFLRIQSPPSPLVLYIPIPLNLILPLTSPPVLRQSSWITHTAHSIRLRVKEKKMKAPST